MTKGQEGYDKYQQRGKKPRRGGEGEQREDDFKRDDFKRDNFATEAPQQREYQPRGRGSYRGAYKPRHGENEPHYAEQPENEDQTVYDIEPNQYRGRGGRGRGRGNRNFQKQERETADGYQYQEEPGYTGGAKKYRLKDTTKGKETREGVAAAVVVKKKSQANDKDKTKKDGKPSE